MLVRIAIWNLEGTAATIEELRDYLRAESVDAFEKVEGLRYKAWFSDPATNRWGALHIWESADAASAPMPSRARELIGKGPDVLDDYDLEASIEGVFQVAELARRGLAFEY